MSWNYRVIRHIGPKGNVAFQIHEVYYDDEGTPISWTEKPVAPVGGALLALQRELRLFIDATERPILDAETLPYLGEHTLRASGHAGRGSGDG